MKEEIKRLPQTLSELRKQEDEDDYSPRPRGGKPYKRKFLISFKKNEGK